MTLTVHDSLNVNNFTRDLLNTRSLSIGMVQGMINSIMLREYRYAFTQCRSARPIINMTSEELLTRYAAGDRNFSELDLASINLFNQKLSFTNFSRANLSQSDMRGVDLFGADLTWTNLRNANLTGANLARANFRGAKLEGCDLRGANLRRASFKGSFYDRTTQFPEGFQLTLRG